MYYPFLRGRQFELIALRELSFEGKIEGYVTPIIEPVKKSLNGLKLANSIFTEAGQPIYLIVNPLVGEVKGDTSYYLDFLEDLGNSSIRPAFQYSKNAGYISSAIEKYNLQDCMLLGNSNIQIGTEGFEELVELASVSKIVIFEPSKNRELNHFLKGSGKQFIRMDDLFKGELRNSDYLDKGSHLFSEEHQYYKIDGFDGFSDYTALSSEFIEGGSTPRAVVIHLTYLNKKEQIWISHFTSITNDSIVNVQGKFAEAAKKTIDYCRENSLDNSAIGELENFYNTAHYPGLGTVKKISIKNHLFVVVDFLKNRT